MNYIDNRVKNTLPCFFSVARKFIPNPFIVPIALAILSAVYLYCRGFSVAAKIISASIKIIPTPTKTILTVASSDDIDSLTNRVEQLTDMNRRAIQRKSELTKILFYGPLWEKQESIAKEMAKVLGLKYHCFDGRKLGNDQYREDMKWDTVLRRATSSKKPEVFIFISHADEICRDRALYPYTSRNQLPTILYYTGSPHQTFLLCLGISSLRDLDPAIASRYRDILSVY